MTPQTFPILATADESWTSYIPLIWQALGETLYMVVFAAALTFVLGMLIGIALYVTSPGGIRPLRWINVPLGLYVNISRSLPFLILIIVLIIFGAGKIPQLGEGLGKAIKGFKKSVHEADAIDVTPPPVEPTPAQPTPMAQGQAAQPAPAQPEQQVKQG